MGRAIFRLGRRALGRGLGGAAVLLAATIALGGCAAEPQSQQSLETPSPSPTSVPDPPSAEEIRAEEARRYVAAASLHERAASVVMATIPTLEPAEAREFVQDLGLGGFILMGSNVPSDAGSLLAFTEELATDAELPTLIAIDQEGGEVSRLPWDTLPAAATLKHEPPEATGTAFASRANLLKDVGVNVNFGIVADLPSDEGSFIYNRALGDSVDGSAARVDAAIRAEQGLVASTLKHFPGHGAAPGDSHFGVPTSHVTLDEWRATHAVPFQSGIDSGAELLMFGHLSFPEIDGLPATLSPVWHQIARDELGFTGVSVTDDLGMLLSSGLPEYQDPVNNAVQALAAGNDLLLIIASSDYATVEASIAGIVTAVEEGALPNERLEEAAIRVAELRLRLA